MTIPQIKRALARITYMDGWTFEAFEHRSEGQKLRIVVPDLPNSYRPDVKTTLGINTFIPPCENEEQFFTWLGYRLRRIWEHESDEWFKVDGRQFYDPHAEPAA